MFFNRNRVAYYAVFDGHGGSRASIYASKWLHIHLSHKLPKGTRLLKIKNVIVIRENVMSLSLTDC